MVLKCFESAAQHADGSLGKGCVPPNQMEQVSVAIVEKYQAVASEIEWFAQKIHLKILQVRIGAFKVIHRNGQVADAGIFVVRHILGRARSLGRDDFEQRAVGRADEPITGVGEVYVKAEMIHVPVRETLGIRRGNRRMLQALKHK